jgi:hypothetical protein
MRKTLTLLLLLAGTMVKAQIQAPDTVCVGNPFIVTSDDTAQEYTFSPNASGSVFSVGAAHTIATGGSVQIGGSATMVNDGGNYYGFVVSSDFHLFRLDFGTNPNSTPVVNDMGNPGGEFYFFPHGIEMIKDGGQWYGFIMDGARLIRLSFGTSLTNTPTVYGMDYPLELYYSMQVTIKKYHGKWVGFVGSFGSRRFARLDFGTSLTNTPTAFAFADRPAPFTPCYLTLHEQNGNWYILATNLTSNSLIRYDFGTDLMNNTPILNDLGNPGGLLNYPRGINILRNCGGFDALIMNEGGDVIKLDFANNITNTPTTTSLGTLGAPAAMEEMSPYWYNDTLYMMSINFLTPSTVIQFPVMSLPNSQTSYSSSFTHTYTTPGTYQLNMLTDEADPRDGRARCKTIVAVAAINLTITAHGDTLSVPPGYTSYQWYFNGVPIDATGSEIIANQNGVYSVTATNEGGCAGTSGNYLHFMTGVDNMQNNAQVKIYPNPAVGTATIDLSALSGNISVQLYNVVGAKVQQYAAAGGSKLQLDLSQLPRGMYNVRVMTSTQSATTQIVLQ